MVDLKSDNKTEIIIKVKNVELSLSEIIKKVIIYKRLIIDNLEHFKNL